MAARTWTQEQRQRQREAIQRWKPWNQSTGPVSQEGKAVAARSAYKGGQRTALRKLVQELHLALKAQSENLSESPNARSA